MPPFKKPIGRVAEKRTTGNVQQSTFIAVSASSGGCKTGGCNATANCIMNDALTQLAISSVINTELGKPNAGNLSNFVEAVQDAVANSLEGFDYNDALNQWIQENPLTDYTNIGNFCTGVAACLVASGIPLGTPLFMLDGMQVSVGDTISTTVTTGIDGAGLVTIDVNGVSDTFSIAAYVASQIASIPTTNTFTGDGSGLLSSTVNGITDTYNITPDVKAAETTTTITNTVGGHQIATYTNEDSVTVNINETVTSLATPTLVANILTIPFVNENGVTQTVTVDLSSVAPTTDIHITGASYNAALNNLIITDNDGNTYTVNLGEFSITTNVLPNGDTQVSQEGVVKFTVPGTASSIINVPTGNLVATNVQDALNELQSDIDTLTSGGGFTTSDTATVDLTKSGVNISADVIVSTDLCNKLQARANGLYAESEAVFETNTTNWSTDLVAIPGNNFLKNTENGYVVFKKCDGTVIDITLPRSTGWKNIDVTTMNGAIYTPGDTPTSILGGYDYYIRLLNVAIPSPGTAPSGTDWQLEVKFSGVYFCGNYINESEHQTDIGFVGGTQVMLGETRTPINKGNTTNIEQVTGIANGNVTAVNIRMIQSMLNGLTPSTTTIDAAYATFAYNWSLIDL